MTPPAQRIKLDRKSLRAPDEFQTVTTQAAAWVQTHRPALIAAGLVAAALAATLAGLGWWRSNRAAAAAIRFQAAHADYQASRWPEAAEAFAGLEREYSGTPYGRLAALYEGHALSRKPDPAAAATAYDRFLANGPETDYLKQEALLRLGFARDATGDAAGAQRAFEAAAALTGPFSIDARLALARRLEAAGQADRARQQYQAILKESPTASVREFLRTKVPADVAAPGANTQ